MGNVALEVKMSESGTRKEEILKEAYLRVKRMKI